MSEIFHQFLLAFIPLFVAIDPIGLIPVFLGITRGMSEKNLKKTIVQGTLTATCVAVLFLFLGKLIFKFLGITIQDFQIAGGVILMILASRDLLGGSANESFTQEDLGIVPLGTPLIAGPALITTLLILADSVGLFYTLLALIVNFIIIGFVFRFNSTAAKLIGIPGLKVFSKIISLLLVAIAVHMIRLGITH